MRLLSLVLQNKKGQNVIIATSPSLQTRTCILYSNFIYQHILETYRRRLKIERTLTLQANLNCVLSINKDYILYIFVQKNDLSLAFDGVKKITQFYSSNIKMFSGSSQVRLQIISKKFVQFMSVMEQFLYTRQIEIKDYLPLLSQPFSKKKGADQQIFNKFNHISNQNDKKIIFDSHIQSFLIQQKEIKKKCKIIDQAKKLVFKIQDDLDILQSDPQKQYYSSHYKRNIIKFALCNRKRNIQISTSMIPSQSLIYEMIQQIIQENEIVQQSVILIENERIKLKMNEKLQLSLQNAKIKQVLQFGQIVAEGTQKQTAFLNLINHEQYWNNSKIINKRISPASINDAVDMITQIKFNTQSNYKSKAIIDYIIRKQSFTPEKIPLLFVYTRQVSSSNIQFTFKYKMNEKWKNRLYDVDISVHLNKQFVVMDCKSVPSAYSLKNNKITWKTKQILPNSNNSKGKIILAFGSSNISPKHIIKEIKLTMKASCGLIDNLRAECEQKWGNIAEPQRILLIEYKISPNDQSKSEEHIK